MLQSRTGLFLRSATKHTKPCVGSIISTRSFSTSCPQLQNDKQQTPKQPTEQKSKEDEDLEFIIEQAYMKKKVEQAAENEKLKRVLGAAKAKQKRKAYFVVGFGLVAAVLIILFVISVHQRDTTGVQSETTKDRKF